MQLVEAISGLVHRGEIMRNQGGFLSSDSEIAP